MDNTRDPKTGRFIVGNNAHQLESSAAARRIYATLRELATPEFIREQIASLLAQGGQVQRQTLQMILDRIAPEVKQLAVTTDGVVSHWNVSTLTPEEQASLQALALKSLGGTESPLIEAEFTPVQEQAIRVQT